MAHQKLSSRAKRKIRIRKKIFGTVERPRLVVYRSNRAVYAQIVDDTVQKTLASSHSLKDAKMPLKQAADLVGKTIAERALQCKVSQVVFDRNGYQYHGVIKQVADAARGAGLKF